MAVDGARRLAVPHPAPPRAAELDRAGHRRSRRSRSARPSSPRRRCRSSVSASRATIMSWGNDISQAQRDLRTDPQTLIYPSIALSHHRAQLHPARRGRARRARPEGEGTPMSHDRQHGTTVHERRRRCSRSRTSRSASRPQNGSCPPCAASTSPSCPGETARDRGRVRLRQVDDRARRSSTCCRAPARSPAVRSSSRAGPHEAHRRARWRTSAAA